MTASEKSDEWLMAQVAAGQRAHLEVLIRRFASPLLTFIHRMVGDMHRSEELFQEVFLAVWVKRHQYQFPRTFKSWLFAIAINKCRETYRKRLVSTISLHAQEGSAEPPTLERSPSESAIATEQATMVGAAVTELPAQQRAVVVLRIWDGLSYAQIAEVLGVTEATVRSHMHHGLAGLRKSLEPRLHGSA